MDLKPPKSLVPSCRWDQEHSLDQHQTSVNRDQVPVLWDRVSQTIGMRDILALRSARRRARRRRSLGFS